MMCAFCLYKVKYLYCITSSKLGWEINGDWRNGVILKSIKCHVRKNEMSHQYFCKNTTSCQQKWLCQYFVNFFSNWWITVKLNPKKVWAIFFFLNITGNISIYHFWREEWSNINSWSASWNNFITIHKEIMCTCNWKYVVSKPAPSDNICFFVRPCSLILLSQSRNW